MDISLEKDKVFVVDDVSMEEIETGKIYGYVVKINGNPIESVRLRLKGIKTKVSKNTSSDADGFFEFTGLGADTYVILAKKKGYKKAKQIVKLEDGESTEIEIEMRKTSKRSVTMREY
ncbi:MAG TPA: carboxypeptidase-like regulatory domain-containing protein [Candidatus Wunengus sp. YC60]|uniref:carboxypeptidase-like regulatory domain-containing protein n=1 Tax=Candidatus Wunengus sp. YC60 TaxID=3367697 RepID=UPI0040250E4A